VLEQLTSLDDYCSIEELVRPEKVTPFQELRQTFKFKYEGTRSQQDAYGFVKISLKELDFFGKPAIAVTLID